MCCPFHNMVCSRSCLVLSPYAHLKAWWSRSHACMMDRFSWACKGQELPFLPPTFVRHLAAQPESLGIITWLLHCCSLAACAKDMAASSTCLIVAMNAQTLETYLSVFTKYQILWTNICLLFLCRSSSWYGLRRNVGWAGILCSFFCILPSSPGISLLLCECYPFHNMASSRTHLVLSPYAHPKAWWSRSHACVMDGCQG